MFSSLTQIQISGLIALVVSMPFLIKSVRNLYFAKASKQWPKVSGTINEVSNFGSTQKLRMQYVYTINEHTYNSNRILFSNSNSAKRRRAKAFQKKYALHQIIDVFYNPKNPKQSVLEPGRNEGLVLAIIILGVLFVFGCLALFNQIFFLELMGSIFKLFN